MAKVRFQMFLDETQKETLERLQRDAHVPMAEMVREAIDRYITEYREKKKIPARNTAIEKLLSVSGVCEGGPKDLADSHDKYLYGILKK